MRSPQFFSPVRGEIWLVQFEPSVGAETQKTRPALVLSRTDAGVLPLRVVVPVTTFQSRFAEFPWMVEVLPDESNGLKNRSVLDCFQPRSLDLQRFVRRWGEVDAATVENAARTVAEVLGVDLQP